MKRVELRWAVLGVWGVITACVGMAAGTAVARASSDVRLVETASGQRAFWTEEQIADFSKKRQATGLCGGYFDVTDFPVDLPPAIRVQDIFDERVPRQAEKVEALSAGLDAGKWFEIVTRLASFHNRFYKSDSGVASMEWIRDRFTELARGRPDFSVELVRHNGFSQPSVIARLHGRGPYSAQRVILGAHGDSISWGSGVLVSQARAPGADDDASGVASLLEVFRVLVGAGYQPDRTLEFIVYAAEERGLLGSQAIARDYNQRGLDVAAVLQLDMTGYPGSARTILLVDDYVSKGLTRFIEMLIDSYVHVKWAEDGCGYACSDHASWTKAGFPSAFPFESPDDKINPNIHSASDTPETLDVLFAQGIVKLGLAYAIELATEPGASLVF